MEEMADRGRYNIENDGGFEMGVNSVNDAGSAYGAAFRNKPIFFMTGKETEAFFDGKMRRNMELREDTCTLSSNDTYRRPNSGGVCHTDSAPFPEYPDCFSTVLPPYPPDRQR